MIAAQHPPTKQVQFFLPYISFSKGLLISPLSVYKKSQNDTYWYCATEDKAYEETGGGRGGGYWGWSRGDD